MKPWHEALIRCYKSAYKNLSQSWSLKYIRRSLVKDCGIDIVYTINSTVYYVFE